MKIFVSRFFLGCSFYRATTSFATHTQKAKEIVEESNEKNYEEGNQEQNHMSDSNRFTPWENALVLIYFLRHVELPIVIVLEWEDLLVWVRILKRAWEGNSLIIIRMSHLHLICTTWEFKNRMWNFMACYQILRSKIDQQQNH